MMRMILEICSNNDPSLLGVSGVPEIVRTERRCGRRTEVLPESASDGPILTLQKGNGKCYI